MPNETNEVEPAPKLNVILHGTFAYIDKAGENCIDALIPLPHSEDKMDHVFRAGNWLGETELRHGTYRLEGVKKTGIASLDYKKNLIYKTDCKRHSRLPDKEYARLIFPRPERISSLRLADVDFAKRPGELLGDPGVTPRGAALQVFTYEIESDSSLRLQKLSERKPEKQKKIEAPEVPLTGHRWEPVYTGDFANLHIFSAEDHPDDPRHTSQAFEKTGGLLMLDTKKLKLNQVHRARGIDDRDLPPGIIAEETEDLAVRTIRIARLGRLRRQKADLSQAWYGNEALDGNPSACLCEACN